MWHPTAWNNHLTLAANSNRYTSVSNSPIRAYFLRNNRLMLLNEQTGVTREAIATEAQRHEILYGAKKHNGLVESLFAGGTDIIVTESTVEREHGDSVC